MLANLHASKTYEAGDAADEQNTKPAFAALAYPVITMKEPLTFRPGVPLLLGDKPTPEVVASRSNELLVTAQTSPCFIAHALDDPLVPADNSLLMLAALRQAGVKCEAHLFQEGGHGFGVGVAGQAHELWLEAFDRWRKRLA